MIRSRSTRVFAAFFACSLATGALFAGPISITNPGFEADGDVTGPGIITGWTASAATYGVDTATATEAVRSARLNNPGTLSQLTSETITTGYTYQLTADVGQLAGFSGGVARLELYGSTSGAIWQSLNIFPPSGGWLTDQFVRFDATATQAGQTLGIRLLSTGGTELRFDNVLLKRTLDSDYDGIEDVFETNTGTYVSPTNTGSNSNNYDTDGDGARDGAEVNMGFNPTAANSRPLRIMCMGDSITVGYTDNPNYLVPFEYGYRSGLYTRLNNAGYKFSFVGFSNQPWFGPPHYYNPPPSGPSRDGDPTRGDTVFPKLDLPALGQNGHHGYGGNGISAMNAAWVTSDKPDVILLLIGINGIGTGSPAALASKVDEILAAKNPSAHLIVAQITPYGGFNQALYDYNIYIRDTLVPTKAGQGHKISTVDLYSLFLTDPENHASSIATGRHSNSAGNHPTNALYDQMAEAWFQGIESLSLNGPDALPPTIVSLSPMDGATNVPTGGNLVVVFNEDVQKGTTGNIVIKKSSDNSIVETIPVTSSQAGLSGRNLIIDPSVTLDSGTAYHVQIDAGVILDDTTPTANAFAGIADNMRWNFTTNVPDTFPPTISVLSPADNSTGVSLITDLAITFNENIQRGSGTIELRKTGDNSLIESFPVASANVSISGVNVTIDRAVALEANTGYHAVIPSGAFKDLYDLPYGGTSDATTWNFTSGTFSTGPVAVTNHSFEGGLGGTGVGTVAAGWTWNGTITWGHQVGNNGGVGPGDGSAKHYVIQGNANGTENWELSQITGEVIQAGKTYTLEVDLYADAGWATTTQGKIQLIARDGVGAINLLAETTGGFGLTAGAWARNQKVEYTATAAQAGKSLGIGLVTHVSNGNLAFDNVRITASSSSGPDTTPPLLNSKAPADNATGVAGNTHITATFDEAIQLGSGVITLDNLSGGADLVIDVASHGGQLSVAGNVLTINPASDLAGAANHAVLLAPGSVMDTATVPNAFAGISDTVIWNFATAVPDSIVPGVSSLSPLDNASNVAVNANLVITFDENVRKGLGNLVITQTGGSVFETIPITDARITVSGATVTIDPTGTLANNTACRVEIAGGAIEDLAGNGFPGISGATGWNFTTIAAATGGPITVANHSFEGGLDPTGIGSVPVGWTWSGTVTWGHSVENNAGIGPSDGSVKHYSIQGNANNNNNWELSQITSEVIQEGKTYILEVDIYARSGWAANTEGKIQLIARNGAGVINLLAESTGGFGLTAGAWARNQRVEYTATAAQAGKSLGIGLATHVSNFNLAFDNVRLTATMPPPSNTFATWIGGFGLAAGDKDFLDDPDGDLLSNGIEAWFGTHPGEVSIGISGVTKNGNSVVFSHPRNPTLLTDLTSFYEWSPDLSMWYSGDGVQGPPGGTTMTVTTDTSGPATWVTATPSGEMERVFLRIMVR